MDTTSERRLYRIAEAAAVSGISRSSMYRLIAENRVKTVSILGRQRISAAELDRIAVEGVPVDPQTRSAVGR
jgi:excisionase family DNA binding protein